MLADVFLFLGIYLSLLVFTFFPGFLFLKLFKRTFVVEGLYTKAFLSFISGLILLVCAFSIYKTSGQTVTLFFPFIFVLAFYKKKITLKAPRTEQAGKRDPVTYAGMGVTALLPFIYFSLVVFKPGAFHFRTLEYDNAVYGQLSSYLSDSGLENKWYSYFTDLSTVKGLEPYHYVDCWLTAFIMSMFKTHPLISFYLVSYPLFITISLMGILALIERVKKIEIREHLMAFALLFMGAVFGIKNANYHFNTMACEIPLQHYGEKFAVYYPFIILSCLLFSYGFTVEALISSLSLCVVSSTLFPAMCLACILLFMFRSGKTDGATKLKLILILLSIFIFYKLFSYQQASSVNTRHILAFSDLGTFDFTFQWFKLAASNFSYAFVKSLLCFVASYFYIPLLLLVIFYSRNTALLKLSASIGLLCLSGLLCACFLYRFPDNYQLFTNTLPVLHVLCILILISLLFSPRPFIKLSAQFFTGAFAIYTVLNSLLEYRRLSDSLSVSDDYILQAKALVIQNKAHQKIAFICGQNDADFLQNNRAKNYLSHLPYLGIDPVPLRLSVLDVISTSHVEAVKEDYDMIAKHELYYTFSLAHRELIAKSDSLQLRFLRDYKIQYLLLSPNTGIPDFVKTSHATIVRDQKTGIRFIRLRFS